MKKLMRNITPAIALALVVLPVLAKNIKGLTPLEMQVRHQLVTMPWYSLFDNLKFQVNGSCVVLLGKTVRPTVKNLAERRVARLEGVTEVDNRIEVLPASFYDDQLRLRVARAIYANPTLGKYAVDTLRTIHIVVKNGRVTLEGIVNREIEKHVAFLEANGVSGVFKVMNNLRVEQQKES